MADTIEIIQGTATTIEIAGLQGPQGPAGSNGTNGQGVPVGGTTGQVLRKVSGTNYDTEWAAAGSGSGSVTSVALAGTGLSISGSPITTSGTITANVAYGTTAGTACQGNDSRLTNARTPSSTLAHAASHAAGGSDALTPSSIGAGRYKLQSYAFTSADQTITDTITVAGKTVISLDWGFPDGSGDCVYDLTVVGGALGDELIIVGTGDNPPGFASLSVTITLDNYTSDPISITSGDLNLFARYVRGLNGQWVDLADNLEPADNAFRVVSFADATKKVAFEVDGLTTETTRTLTIPDSSGTIALTQQPADYEVTDSTNGLILKSPNNTRWRLTINDDGTLSRAALALMTLLAFATSGLAQVRDMVTDTNGNIVTGRTNALAFSNRVSLPIASGAAATNSLLTADGAGGSSFVASRVQRVTLTNNFSVTNATDLNATNGNVPNMTVNLDANSLYVARWSVLLTCGAEGARLEAIAGAFTNGIINQSVAGSLGRPSFSYGDTYFLTSGARQYMSLVGFSGAGFTSGVTNGVFNGIAQFRTGASNTTLFWRFNQNSASNVATTLLSNSIFYVEKLSP